MTAAIVGWDIGGAHLKAAVVDEGNQVLTVRQEACPLWLGMDRLDLALDRMLEILNPGPHIRHAMTMTGELADHFVHREEGVLALTGAMARRFGAGNVRVFAGHRGFLHADFIGAADTASIASANWLASGFWVAATLGEALFVDIGSTTTDLLPIHENRVRHRGYTDSERMRYDELLYTGIVRTPAMMLAQRVPLDGAWVGVMAEHFATTADVYRLTGELPEYADQMAAADHGAKTSEGSQQRLARLFGRDAGSLPSRSWTLLAEFLREQQLSTIRAAVELQLSRGLLGRTAPLVGAGVGRFLVRELAGRLQRPYLDFSALFLMSTRQNDFRIADCGPAAAVACLALREDGSP
jgi:probable H4MPT-linked C1 transfer pathway protein